MVENIIVIDDQEMTRKLIKGLLEKRGFKVAMAKDGGDAVEKFEGGYRPDVILLDLNMPNLNGLDVLDAVRGKCKMMDVPVLMLTGDGRKETVIECIEKGADDFMVKPINAVTLMDRLYPYAFNFGVADLVSAVSLLDPRSRLETKPNFLNSHIDVDVEEHAWYKTKMGKISLLLKLPLEVPLHKIQMEVQSSSIQKLLEVYSYTQIRIRKIWPKK